MGSIAATATDQVDPTLGYWILGLAATGFAICYAAACWIWPFTSCRKCEGAGRFRSPTGKNWRKCPRCAGGGSKIRTGRKVWNYFRTARNKVPG
jgi:hypothetical protein